MSGIRRREYGGMTGYSGGKHDALSIVAVSPSWMTIRATFERNESSGNVAARVVPLRQRLVVLVKGANFQDLVEGNYGGLGGQSALSPTRGNPAQEKRAAHHEC